jgi:hypothetical protein
MPERKKKRNKFTRKMYYVEVDWDQDWIYNHFYKDFFPMTLSLFKPIALLRANSLIQPNGPSQGHTFLLH